MAWIADTYLQVYPGEIDALGCEVQLRARDRGSTL
jgi:hypothetical protein